MIFICEHGKLIYENDAINYPKFVWDTVVKLVGGVNQTRLQGYVRDTETDLAIEGATVTSTDGVYSKVTDSAGRYEFGQITGGARSFVVRKDGYVDVPITVDLETGVTKNLSIMMVKIIP